MIQPNAKCYCGKNEYPIEMPELDYTKPDAELFEDALHYMAVQWSSTEGHPHHKSAMRANGTVIRGAGRVYIAGRGWSVSFYTPEFIKSHAEAIAAANWEALAELMQVKSVWQAPEVV